MSASARGFCPARLINVRATVETDVGSGSDEALVMFYPRATDHTRRDMHQRNCS
jgi:hypothetical protein